jgi:HlyD family secretion protein
MKKFLTWFIVIALLAGGVGGFIWWRRRQAAPQGPEVLRTGEVIRGDLDITIPTSGNVVTEQRTELQFEIPGIVAAVDVAVSDRVTAGQELARLETEDLERSVQQAEIALDQAQLNLDVLREPADPEDVRLAELAVQDAAQSMAVAQASMEAAEAQGGRNVRVAQEAAEDTQEAYESLLETIDTYDLHPSHAAGMNAANQEAQGNVGITQVRADQQLQQARSQWLAAYSAYEQAVHNLETLQEPPDADKVRQAELQIEQAELNLESAQETLASAILEAPFDGVVAAVNLQEGVPAPTGRPAIVLLDDTSYFVDVTVDEMDISAVAVGQTAEVTLDAYPDTPLPGTVERIATVPSASGLGGGIVAYDLRVRLTDTDGLAVRDGMTANLVLQTERVEDVLLVPAWAVRTDQETGEVYVYRMAGEVPQRVNVTTGARNEDYIEIIAGLAEGDVVAQVSEARNFLEMQGPPSQR